MIIACIKYLNKENLPLMQYFLPNLKDFFNSWVIFTMGAFGIPAEIKLFQSLNLQEGNFKVRKSGYYMIRR